MDFIQEFPKLAPRDQARFKTVVTRLWAGEAIMPGSPMKPDPDWTFVERYHPLVASYLDFGDWDLDFRHKPPMARAVHRSARLRARFNKFETMATLVLRIVYHEQMGTTMDREDSIVTIKELRDRLHQEGLSTWQLSGRKLRDTLRVLARHQLVRIPRGFEGADDEEIIVTPVMEAVLPENLAEYRARLTQYARVPDGATRGEGEEAAGDDSDVEEAEEVEETDPEGHPEALGASP